MLVDLCWTESAIALLVHLELRYINGKTEVDKLDKTFVAHFR